MGVYFSLRICMPLKRQMEVIMERLSEEWQVLLKLLGQALYTENEVRDPAIRQLSFTQWEYIVKKARKHGVLPLLYERLKCEEGFPSNLFGHVKSLSRKTVMQSYRLLYLTNYVVKVLEQSSITVIVLKGVSTAEYYPYPELRKSGDIDLLLPGTEELATVGCLLEERGFVLKENQHANHHVIYESKEGIAIELHTMLAEPFDNARLNLYLKKLSVDCISHSKRQNIMGSSLLVLEEAYHAYYLLIHMLQHILGSGFGLKLLCDWVVFWNREIAVEEQEEYRKLVQESGLQHFSDGITSVCIRYLGLKESGAQLIMTEAFTRDDTDYMLKEILEAEEFGKADRNRMVILRGTAPIDYLRELHHQMRLRYPGHEKNILLWPVLWICTLGNFLHNNRIVRRTSLWTILKKTHHRSKRKGRLYHIK